VSLLTTYRPKFCAQCGDKIIRLRWRLWTSRRFCDGCAPEFRKESWQSSFALIATLLCLGFIAGRALKPEPAPLIIQRNAPGPASSQEATNKPSVNLKEAEAGVSNNQNSTGAEQVYICGARTKKGTPCSRRVHGLVRCWQHRGMPAMLPPEKLIVKE